MLYIADQPLILGILLAAATSLVSFHLGLFPDPKIHLVFSHPPTRAAPDLLCPIHPIDPLHPQPQPPCLVARPHTQGSPRPCLLFSPLLDPEWIVSTSASPPPCAPTPPATTAAAGASPWISSHRQDLASSDPPPTAGNRFPSTSRTSPALRHGSAPSLPSLRRSSCAGPSQPRRSPLAAMTIDGRCIPCFCV